MDGKGLIPEAVTAKELAAKVGWPEARARHVLEGLRERGLATIDADERYTITGGGMSVGERVGVVKPMKDWPVEMVGSR